MNCRRGPVRHGQANPHDHEDVGMRTRSRASRSGGDRQGSHRTLPGLSWNVRISRRFGEAEVISFPGSVRDLGAEEIRLACTGDGETELHARRSPRGLRPRPRGLSSPCPVFLRNAESCTAAGVTVTKPLAVGRSPALGRSRPGDQRLAERNRRPKAVGIGQACRRAAAGRGGTRRRSASRTPGEMRLPFPHHEVREAARSSRRNNCVPGCKTKQSRVLAHQIDERQGVEGRRFLVGSTPKGKSRSTLVGWKDGANENQ